MPLIPEAFQVNDLVELHDGRLAVLIRRETKGFKAKIVERWLDPLAPKPIATSEIEIMSAHIKHLLEDERVSWVSPAYLHLTTNGPYASEYGVAANLQKELGPLSLCIIFENEISQVTSGIYVINNAQVVVTSRVRTKRPTRAVLEYVVKHYSLHDNPGLPPFGEFVADSEDDVTAIQFVTRAFGQLEIKSKEFYGAESKSPDDLWWTSTFEGVFVATAVKRLGEDLFVRLCEDRWKKETKWEPSRDLPTGITQRIVDVYREAQSFVRNAVPDCLAWIGDDRWSQDEGWREVQQALAPEYRVNQPRWDTNFAMSLAADIATGLEDYLLAESVDLERNVAEANAKEIVVWNAAEREDPATETGMAIPHGDHEHLIKFLRSEFGPGILEITEVTGYQWSGEGFQDLASLRMSKPGLLILEGAAGTGKTITMIHRAVEAAGRVEKVLVVAPTHMFKRRIKYLLRRIDYRGQKFRRNNIEVSTANLMGGEIRKIASANAYNRRTLKWGSERHRKQWERMLNWYHRHSDYGTQTSMNDRQYISRSIAIEELSLHSEIRQVESDVPSTQLSIPAYGAIFVDEAQDLKGWDWMKLASYCVAFVEREPSTPPELVALVDRRQDIFGVIPNFDVTGPDEDEEGTEEQPARSIVKDTNGILRTPLFDVTRTPTDARASLRYERAPQKALQKFAIGYKEIQSLQKLFQARIDNGRWPVEMKSLTTTLRQSQDLARKAARVASLIERQHSLDDSSLNATPLTDLQGTSAFSRLKVNTADELRQALFSEFETADRVDSLYPMAIAVQSKVEAVALTLMTAQSSTRIQSNVLCQSWTGPVARDRDDKPLMSPIVDSHPLAKKTLGPGVLTLVAPENLKRNGGHRGLHRIGRDCENYGSLKLSNGSRKISIGTIAGLRGLEFGSLIGVLKEQESASAQQMYVLHSRPRYRLTLVETLGDVLVNTAEGAAARLIDGSLPPWGGIIFCRLDALTQGMRENPGELLAELELDRARLSALWREMAGPYGKDDICVAKWGYHQRQSMSSEAHPSR